MFLHGRMTFIYNMVRISILLARFWCFTGVSWLFLIFCHAYLANSFYLWYYLLIHLCHHRIGVANNMHVCIFVFQETSIWQSAIFRCPQMFLFCACSCVIKLITNVRNEKSESWLYSVVCMNSEDSRLNHQVLWQWDLIKKIMWWSYDLMFEPWVLTIHTNLMGRPIICKYCRLSDAESSLWFMSISPAILTGG